VSALIEFNFEEVKSEYVKNGKIALEEVFRILEGKNENASYDKNKKRIAIICEIGESRVKFFIHSSGKIQCMGARSEKDLYCALEKHFQKVGEIIGIKKISVSIKNIMATAVFDYKIRLDEMENYAENENAENDCEITYRLDIFPAAIYKSKLGTANIFMNGKIVIITTRKENIAPIVKNIEEIIAINKAAIPL
jgi:TATA-box binding protein (TBP) (component of TFIID and TFIIIB)